MSSTAKEATNSPTTSGKLGNPATQDDRKAGGLKLTKKQLTAKRADIVDRVVQQILDESALLPDCIKVSRLKSIARSEFDRDLELQRSRGYSWASPRVRWRMRKAVIRYIGKERTFRENHSSVSGHDKPPVEGYRSKVLSAEDCSPPQLSQEALLRISESHKRAVDLFDQCVTAYNDEIEADPELTKGLPPETRVNQMFHSFAKALVEAQAIEYMAVTGRAGAERWRKMVCESVFSEVAQANPLIGRCFVIYEGRENLAAVIEAAVDGVIEDIASPTGVLPGWREEATRKEKVLWFKVRNGISKQNKKIYDAAIVDPKTWWKWLTDQLPNSSSPAKRIEALLRSGRLPKKN